MNTRAKWVGGIPDLYGTLNEAGTYLNLPEVADAIGLAASTIEDLLSRPPITNPNNPLSAISRPAARIGNQPLYTTEQVNRVLAQQRANDERPRHLGGGDEALKTLSPEEADTRGLASAQELATLVDSHVQTVRRWVRDYEDFPRAVALRARRVGRAGVPEVVWDREAVIEWWRSKKGKIEAAAS